MEDSALVYKGVVKAVRCNGTSPVIVGMSW